MDPITVSLTINNVEHTRTFYPDLVETVGGQGSTVASFLSWIGENFADIGSAQIVNGDIVITAQNGVPIQGQVALGLLDVEASATSQAVDLALPEGSASGGVITLTAFAGLTGDELLIGNTIEFDLYVGGASGGSLINIIYAIEGGETVADFLSYIQEQAEPYTGNEAVLYATLGEDGIVLSMTGEYGFDRLWTGPLTLHYELEATGAIESVASVLGTVDWNNGETITFHGNENGPDQIHVGGFSYQDVDTDNSDYQQVVLELNNSKLDGITDGSTVTLNVLGETISFVVNTVGTAADGELDLSGISVQAARSSAIIAHLISLASGIQSINGLGSIEQGIKNDDTGAFELNSSNSAIVLRLTADQYGNEKLGSADDITFTIVNASSVNQLNVTADETREGSISFTNGTDTPDIDDATGEGDDAQTGRNESIIHYHDNGGEDGSGTYVIDDITDNAPGVTLGGSASEEFEDLDVDDDEEEGVAPDWDDQSYTNPGSGGTGAGYYGEAGATGSNGVQQTHQNADGSYTATDASPVNNAGNVSQGEDSHYGGASGSHHLDGLHTDHLDGATPVTGEAYYDDGHLVGTGAGATGAYHGELTSGASGDDGFDVHAIQDGFAAFTWDHVIQSTVTAASAGADVINHFQVGGDVIGFEGAIENSMFDGYVNYVHASGGTGNVNFDLDQDEFGLIGSDVSWLNKGELSSAENVSILLSLFDISANGEDGERNSSIFAITADDDHNTTAIWAHTQSSDDDETIDANELTLLAMVHTTGGEFSYQNLQLMHHNDPV